MLGVWEYYSIYLSLASTNISIRNDWSIEVSEYSTDIQISQYFMKITLDKKLEYWRIRVQIIGF